MLTDVVATLESADAPTKTGVLAALADLLARRNAATAAVNSRVEALRTAESGAEFAASMAVLTQRAAAAAASAADPAAVDAALAELEAECETLDARFGEVAEFADAIADKRDEIYTALTTRREVLASARAAKVDRLVGTAQRALAAVAEPGGPQRGPRRASRRSSPPTRWWPRSTARPRSCARWARRAGRTSWRRAWPTPGRPPAGSSSTTPSCSTPTAACASGRTASG